jgi:hypothetical protein
MAEGEEITKKCCCSIHCCTGAGVLVGEKPTNGDWKIIITGHGTIEQCYPEGRNVRIRDMANSFGRILRESGHEVKTLDVM